MQVVSVNVGTPRTVTWQGRTFATGIFKEPVAGRVAVAGVNLAGDDQADRAVHGGPDKAVYAYAREDLEWWARERGMTLRPGDFGENLTTAGLDLGARLIGERWRVGSVLLEVAQPRVPCFKLAMRMNDAAFGTAFNASLRTGAYLRIVEEGDVAAGDPIAIVERPAHALRVIDVARTIFFEHAEAARFLEVPQLSEKWHAWARARLASR